MTPTLLKATDRKFIMRRLRILLHVFTLLSCCSITPCKSYENSYFGSFLPFTHRPSQVTRVNLPCLHTVAPPPYNFRMRCPDTANISDWKDSDGAQHRYACSKPPGNAEYLLSGVEGCYKADEGVSGLGAVCGGVQRSAGVLRANPQTSARGQQRYLWISLLAVVLSFLAPSQPPRSIQWPSKKDTLQNSRIRLAHLLDKARRVAK
eukprot:1158247-Pelagomonas_calceolata.AAC.2